jgi:hypothetical protein
VKICTVAMDERTVFASVYCFIPVNGDNTVECEHVKLVLTVECE